MDAIAQRGVDMARALMALRLKRGSLGGSNRDGTIIRQYGKPDLLLTWDAATRFCQEVDEAEHG